MVKYLPNQDSKDEPQVDRHFLFTIVNTVDSSYFPQQLQRIERERVEAAQKVQEDVIEVRGDIMQLLESFGASASHAYSRVSCARSLATLKKNNKKRPRPEFTTEHVRPTDDSARLAQNPQKRAKVTAHSLL